VRAPRWLSLVATMWTLVFWLGCVAVPVGVLLSRIFAAGHGFAALADPDVFAVARATAGQALISMLVSALIGLPLGLAAARASGRLGRWLDTLLILPQGVPTVVAATAWVAWLGRSGWLARAGLPLDWAYSLKAVILAHVFFNAPWIALLVAQARRQLPQGPVDAAATLGASPFARFRLVIWRQLRWALASACAQVLALCSMSFALVLILGGGPPVETLETALYARLRGGAVDLGGAASCAAWEMLLTLAPWALVLVLRSREGGASARVRAPRAARGQTRSWGLLVLCGVFLVPYLAVFFGESTGQDFWKQVSEPLRLSLGIAALSAMGTLVTASLATVATMAAPRAWRALAEALLAIPSGLSVLVLGLGAWLAYGRWIDPFEGSLTAIVVLQVTVFFPLAFRMLWPVAQSAQKAPMEAAWTLGASPWRAFWLVDWPRWRASVFSALALVAGAALGEVAAVSLFYSEKLIPLPLLVSRWMGQYRFEDARAVAALLLVASAAVMAGVSFGTGRSSVET
jgi:thiamine transport system permease protein